MTSSCRRAVSGFAVLAGACFLLSAGPAWADYMSAVLADNPVSYWRLNETGGNGTTMYDSVGYQDGTFVKAAAEDQSYLGSDGPRPPANVGFPANNLAPRFWGTRADEPGATYSGWSRVDVPDSPELSITGSLTLEAWVNMENYGAGSRGIIAKWFGAFGINDRCYSLSYDKNGKLSFGISANGTFAGGKEAGGASVLPLDTWTHVAAVYTAGTSMEIFINGVSDAKLTTGVPASVFDSSRPLMIGTTFETDNGDYCFRGRIDDAAVYDYALSAGQIAAHYDAAFIPIPEPGTLALLATGLLGLLCYAWKRRK